METRELIVDLPLNRIAKGFVLTSAGDELFRYQHNYFTEEEIKNKGFVYPVPKLIVVTSGEADWIIGNITFHVCEGDIVILRPGVLRRFAHIPEETTMECDVYEFIQPFIGSFECRDLFRLPTNESNTVFKYSPAKSDPILNAFRNIKDELKGGRTCCGDIVKSQLVFIAVSLARNMNQEIGSGKTSPWQNTIDRQPSLPFEYPTPHLEFSNIPVSAGHSLNIAEILEYIDTNIKMNISAAALAESVNMSRSYFYKIFQKYTGMTLNEYVLKRRIESTVRFLSTTGCSVLAAAQASGFKSSSGFYKAFKHMTGKSPKEYLRTEKLPQDQQSLEESLKDIKLPSQLDPTRHNAPQMVQISVNTAMPQKDPDNT